MTQATALAEGGLVGDHGKSAKRGITILSAPQWAQAVAAMLEAGGGEALPWQARRANVLIDLSDLGRLVGRKLTIGDPSAGGIVIAINGITYPCEHIDDLHPGLRAALTNDRGGVYGRILNDGLIRVGDSVIG